MTIDAVIKGKALLTIERLDSEWVPFEVHAFVQSCSMGGESTRDMIAEDFGLLDTDTLPVPSIGHKLREGEKATVSVVYEFTYSHDYFGEYDVGLCYHKERVLKRPRPHMRTIKKGRR